MGTRARETSYFGVTEDGAESCTYCNKKGHNADQCYKKAEDTLAERDRVRALRN